jgi:hypothetical protein
VAYLLLLASVATARADGPALINVIQVDGPNIEGHLADFTADSLTLAAPNTQRILLADIMRIEVRQSKSIRSPRKSVLYLANGDRLHVSPRNSDGESITVNWSAFPDWKAVSIPLETVRAMMLRSPTQSSGRVRLRRRLLEQTADTDLLLLANGDEVTGELQSFSAKDFTVETNGAQSLLPWDSVVGLRFNSELVGFPDPKGKRTLITLTDGSRVTADAMELESDVLTIRAVFGTTLVIPVSRVSSLRFLDRRVVYLSDMKPVTTKQTPFLSVKRPPRLDLNVLGAPLTLRGVEFPKGLGMHSRTEVEYDLADGFALFQATIGLDDAARNGGNVVYSVQLDDKSVFTSGPVTGGQTVRALKPIDVSTAKRLKLIVEFGQGGDIRDYANWCDAVLIRK